MEKRSIRIISCLGAAFILLHIGAIILPVEYFWGVDQWKYFPPPVAAIFALTGAALCLAPLRAKRVLPRIGINIFSKRIFYFIIPAASLFPFWFLRQKIFFLGDGYFWIRMLEEGKRYRAFEPLELFLHSVFHEFSGKIIALSPQDSWALVSVLSGAVFVFLAMLLADFLANSYRSKALIFISILSMGTVQIFFGYVETYSIAALFTLLFIYFSVRSFNRRIYIYAAFFVFSLAVCSHISVFAFLPALIYLFFVHMVHSGSFKDKLALVCGIFAVFALPIAITLLIFHSGGFELQDFLKKLSAGGHFLPLFSDQLQPNVGYTLFSHNHFIDMWNEILLIAPISFFAFFMAIIHPGKLKAAILDQRGIFLLIAFMSLLLFSFLFNMEIGVSRDWDLFSVMALPVTIASILLINEIFKERTVTACVIILGCCLLHTIPWIVLNRIESLSFQRYVTLASSTTWSRHAKSYAYDELRYYHEQKDDLISSLQWAEKAYDRIHNERYRLNLAAAHNNVAKMYARRKRFSEAEKHFQKALSYHPDDLLTIRNIALLHFEKRDYDQALMYFGKALHIHADDVESLRKSARIYFNLEMYEEADRYLTRALQANRDEEIQKQLLLFRNRLNNKINR